MPLEIAIHRCALLIQWSLYKYIVLVGWGINAEIQVSRDKFHTHIHLN